jgi:adenylyltransferase/sulfurtransferase
MVPSCSEGGVLGVLCASIGSIQVTEAIKVLTGIGDPLVGSLIVYDALEMTYRKIKMRKDPNCAVCGEYPTVTELIDYEAFCGAVSTEAAEAIIDSTINVRQLDEMLKARERGERDFLLIDVREPNEYDIVSIPGAVLIPKNEFLMGDALAKMPTDKQIVLHCKVGGRSAEVLAAVKGAGFKDAIHVGGGILAWVSQIEPDKPSY